MSIIDKIFNPFKETIFIKEDSSLEEQLKELKEIQENNNSPELAKDINLIELGIKGENEISFELKNSNLGLYVLRDVTIKVDDIKAQIDYVVISKGYTYLIECKNLIGNIYVDNHGQFQREYELNNKKIKESMYSPYTQAIRHKEILKRRWMASKNKLTIAIREKHFDNLWYKPLVVLANPKSILNIKYAPKDIKNSIVRVDQLVKYIENDLKHYDKDLLSNQKQMSEVAQNWLEINTNEYISIATKYRNTNNINLETVDTLSEELKQFRTTKSKKMNVPAYYIFTDKELDLLLIKRPKNIEELKLILSEIKVKCHGEEIIKIINK